MFDVVIWSQKAPFVARIFHDTPWKAYNHQDTTLLESREKEAHAASFVRKAYSKGVGVSLAYMTNDVGAGSLESNLEGRLAWWENYKHTQKHDQLENQTNQIPLQNN